MRIRIVFRWMRRRSHNYDFKRFGVGAKSESPRTGLHPARPRKAEINLPDVTQLRPHAGEGMCCPELVNVERLPAELGGNLYGKSRICSATYITGRNGKPILAASQKSDLSATGM
jgi:hypothetical protein